MTGKTSKYAVEQAQEQLRQVPESAAEYKEAQRLLVQAAARLKEMEAQDLRERAPALREKLRMAYEEVLSAENPHLNYIRSKLTKSKGGYALWCVHPYFNQYSFSIGHDAKVVSSWIDQNHKELRSAGIVRVGVMSSQGWGGSCWFDI